MHWLKNFGLLFLFTSSLFAFSTSNIQYLYGDFDNNTYFDTQDSGKSTVTLEHYSTHALGDLFAFADYEYAHDGFNFNPDEKSNLYFEISPRASLSKLSSSDLSCGIVKDIYLSAQYNRQIMHNSADFHAYLYGVGVDLEVPGFHLFGLNGYKKNQNFPENTYQLSANYLSADFFGYPIFLTGFTDWTENDFLSQNQLLYNFGSASFLANGDLQAGTEWHYYRVKDTDMKSSVWQFIVKVVW